MSGTDRLVSWAVCAAIEYIWPSLVCALEAEPFEKRRKRDAAPLLPLLI